jgi:hypothetical protein
MLNPLSFLGRFCPYDGFVLDLPDVTTLSVDDRDDPDTTRRLALITRWHRRFMRVGREVILSGSRPDAEGVDWSKIERFGTDYRAGYSRWCQEEICNHFSTKFVMIWQLDGFAVNPELWKNDFLSYDYIGAPWSGLRKEMVVGNGGFSMRSRRFCEEVGKLPRCKPERAEDVYFCHDMRDELVGKGIRFAPAGLADAWSTDYRYGDVSRRFGFHGSYLFRAVSAITNQWIGPARNQKEARR